MEVSDFLLFLQKAREKEREEQIRMQWVQFLPYMDKASYVSFEEYYDRCTGRNIDTRSVEEIVSELEAVHGKKLL